MMGAQVPLWRESIFYNRKEAFVNAKELDEEKALTLLVRGS